MIVPVADLSHPGLQPYAHLTEAQLRNRLEPDQGIFIAESPKVIRVALDAGYQPVSLLCEEKHIAGQAADIVARLGELPVYTGSRALLASLTGYELTRGVLCAMHRPQLPSVEQLCQKQKRIVVVDNVVNSTNTGAILRAAAALGMGAVLFSRHRVPDSLDLYTNLAPPRHGTVARFGLQDCGLGPDSHRRAD